MTAIHVSGFSQALIDALGLALVHFIWQGAGIAVLLMIALTLMQRASSRSRYAACCIAMLALCATPTAMFLVNWTNRAVDAPAMSMAQQDARSATPVAAHGHRGATPNRDMSMHDFSVDLSDPAGQIDPIPNPREIASPPAIANNQSPHLLFKWVVVGWSAGVAVLSVLMTLSWVAAWRLRRRVLPGDAKLIETVARLARQIGLRRRIRLTISDRIDVPCVIGWLRPIVLIPVSALTDLPVHHLEAILLHELAHIRRHDYLVNLLQTLAEIFLFYHPAVWWVSRQIRRERENCCDDIAAGAAGGAMSYSHALLAMEELRAVASPRLALGADGQALLPRVRRLLGVQRDAVRPRWPAGALAAIVVLLAIGLSPLARTRARAQEPPKLDVAGIVRDIRAMDAWIETAQSVRFKIHNEWVNTPEQIEAKKADLKKRYPNTDITPERFPELLPNRPWDQDIAFDRTRTYKRRDAKEDNITLDIRIWNGHEGIAFSSQRNGRRQYGFLKAPGETMDHGLDLPLPNGYCHAPWWVDSYNRQGERPYGSAESYRLKGQQIFHGHDCYMLESNAAPYTMFVGIADHRLYGMEERVRPRSTTAELRAIYPQVAKQFGQAVRDFQEYSKWIATLPTIRRQAVEEETRRRTLALTVPYFTFWYDDYQKLSNGSLFPMHQGYCLYPTEAPDDARAHKAKDAREIYVKEVIIDQPLPDSLFVMDMKEGVPVTDRRYDPFLIYNYKKHFEPEEWNQILNEANERALLNQRIKLNMDAVIGQPAPEFHPATWVNSKALTWADLKGKVVLVDFWAVWCAPCRNDYPKLVDLDKEKDKSGITIIGIHAAGTPPADVKKMMKDFGMEYPICIDGGGQSQFGELFKAYRIGALPQAFVIDRDGKIAAHGTFAQAAAAARGLAAKQ
ncbi:MAG TPA: M56 family metallopeptidase [Humisphaera sp.]|jgi:beta-lactamase regulating signal transducer with metallopeptidase domain/thiol-disulfide isomerase/thioredoxin|nr:M56 family metallopeptidase [Humisphaera sp.]